MTPVRLHASHRRMNREPRFIVRALPARVVVRSLPEKSWNYEP
jgi:hypothetical protein